MQKILYVEDDLSLIDGLKYTLETAGILWIMPERQVRLWHDSSKTLTIYYCWIIVAITIFTL